jgi:signal transduction histidine kinase
MDSKSILVLSGDEVDTEVFTTTRSEWSASAELLTDLTQVFDRLTRSVFHCLALPAEVGDQSGFDIAYGITELFPELPVIVAGTVPDEVPEDLDVRAVSAASVVDDPVVDSVREALDGSSPSVAGRPPSPMETMLLSMFDQIPAHIYAKDADARHVMLSRNELEPTDLLGQTDLDFTELPKEHREAAYRDEINVIENDEPRLEIEEYTDYIDSHSLTSKVPWHDAEGDVTGLVGLTQDITDYKVREHASRRQHERLVKVALVAAHEFRNELQVAHGRLELSAGQDEQVEVVEQSLERIASIVDTVVELASEERHAQRRKPLWLSTLSREVWDTVTNDEATLCIEEDCRIVADPESSSLFVQILFNNALEHAGSAITVTVGTTDDGFYVADDGPGFAVDPPERALDAGFTTVEGNTGFGLYVARSVAQDHNWTLRLSESTTGGARFDVGNVELTE